MNIFRLLGRALGSFLVILIFLIFLGEGVYEGLPTGYQFSAREIWLFVFLILGVAGMLLAWRNELWGGALTLAGGLLFIAINSIPEGRLRGGWVFYCIVLAGALFLASHYTTRRREV
jgi:hypothetical protein